MMAAHNDTVRASIHLVSLVSIRNTTAPHRNTVQSHDIRPLPTDGSLRRKWSRSGIERPRATSITMITRNGSDWPTPCWSQKRPISAWPMPSTYPTAVAIGNDLKSAASAAASAASTRLVMAVTWSVMTGTTRIPPMQAMAEPSDQLSTAIRLGEMPTAAAERSLSDTASVWMPNCDVRYSSHRRNAETMPMPSRIRRSALMLTSP